MSSKKNSKHYSGAKNQPSRAVERYFHRLDMEVGTRPNLLMIIGIIFSFFGVMGLVWMVPFPEFALLQRMNAQNFLNWGSFFIAIAVYAYLKLAPTLSYAMLFTMALMSFFIVQFEYFERDHSVSATLLFAVLLGTALLLCILVFWRRNNVFPALQTLGLVLFVGPLWLWSKVFERLNWKF